MAWWLGERYEDDNKIIERKNKSGWRVASREVHYVDVRMLEKVDRMKGTKK